MREEMASDGEALRLRPQSDMRNSSLRPFVVAATPGAAVLLGMRLGVLRADRPLDTRVRSVEHRPWNQPYGH